MNPEVKQKWVEALRSGKYKQGQGALRTGDGYCCLGVLCELAVKEGVAIRDQLFYGSPVDFRSDREDLVLPLVVSAWAGLSSVSPEVPSQIGEGSRDKVGLAELNDTYGADFERIADVIEEQL